MRVSIHSKLVRALCFSALAFSLGACTTTNGSGPNGGISGPGQERKLPFITPGKPLEERYTPPADEPYTLKPIDAVKIPQQFQRTVVAYPTNEAPGTIIVEPKNHYLYFVGNNGRAIRYGVGVGAAGLGFQGDAKLQYKRKWPRWTPTDDMIKRNPGRYKKYADGVQGGLSNPLGARALYLFQNNIDTYYRIHGTNQPGSIGKSVSAGCIRMLNQDVIDLFERAQTGSKVIVR